MEINIRIDADNNEIHVDLSDEELVLRRAEWKEPPLKEQRGQLYKIC